MSRRIDSLQDALRSSAEFVFSRFQRMGPYPAVAAVLLVWPVTGHANLVPIGYLSWDIIIPGAPGSPGVNAFTIGNLTGDPLTRGNDLPPTLSGSHLPDVQEQVLSSYGREA